MTRIRAGQPRNRDSIIVTRKKFRFLQCQDRPSSRLFHGCPGSPAVQRPGREANHSHLCLVPRLRMSGSVPLLPHVLSQRAQDSLYKQGVTSLLTSIHVPARTNSAIPVCEQPGSTDIARPQPTVSASHHYSQWQGLGWLNAIPLNIAIKCVISMPTSLFLQSGDSKIRKRMHVHCHLRAGVKTAWIGINLQAPFFFLCCWPSGQRSTSLRLSIGLYPHQCDYPITSYISWRQRNATDKNARQFLFVTSLHYDVMEICVVHVAVQT